MGGIESQFLRGQGGRRRAAQFRLRSPAPPVHQIHTSELHHGLEHDRHLERSAQSPITMSEASGPRSCRAPVKVEAIALHYRVVASLKAITQQVDAPVDGVRSSLLSPSKKLEDAARILDEDDRRDQSARAHG